MQLTFSHQKAQVIWKHAIYILFKGAVLCLKKSRKDIYNAVLLQVQLIAA